MPGLTDENVKMVQKVSLELCFENVVRHTREMCCHKFINSLNLSSRLKSQRSSLESFGEGSSVKISREARSVSQWRGDYRTDRVNRIESVTEQYQLSICKD